MGVAAATDTLVRDGEAQAEKRERGTKGGGSRLPIALRSPPRMTSEPFEVPETTRRRLALSEDYLTTTRLGHSPHVPGHLSAGALRRVQHHDEIRMILGIGRDCLGRDLASIIEIFGVDDH
jgi:hypothetical protein